jgi:hypothetical protein
MKKFLFVVAALALGHLAIAQTEPAKKQGRKKFDLSNRANDHLMFQLGYDSWGGKPDSIRTKGFSRSVNLYLMFDFPFKTDPRFSVALGLGIGSSHIFFDKTEVDVKSLDAKLPFRNVADTNHFKKFKLVNAYLEVPVELRFVANPERSDRSAKIAVGLKIGTMVNAHTRGKTLQNRSGNTINGFIEKENSRRYFNGTRLALTSRIGWGNFSLFGQYQVNAFLKEGVGPNLRPYSIGITFSGL